MSKITMYSTALCPFCTMAENLLRAKGVKITNKIFVDQDIELRREMTILTNRRTVPQIFIGETHVGGYDDLCALDRAGKLDSLLAEN